MKLYFYFNIYIFPREIFPMGFFSHFPRCDFSNGENTKNSPYYGEVMIVWDNFCMKNICNCTASLMNKVIESAIYIYQLRLAKTGILSHTARHCKLASLPWTPLQNLDIIPHITTSCKRMQRQESPYTYM